jgi:hypothetical protein
MWRATLPNRTIFVEAVRWYDAREICRRVCPGEEYERYWYELTETSAVLHTNDVVYRMADHKADGAVVVPRPASVEAARLNGAPAKVDLKKKKQRQAKKRP